MWPGGCLVFGFGTAALNFQSYNQLVNYYPHMRYLTLECCFQKTFSNLVGSSGHPAWHIHIESVFALSFQENVEVFKVTGQNGQHSFLFRLWQGALYLLVRRYSISIRVWGIASLSLLRSFHNLLEDTRNSLTLSFCPPLTLLGLRSM